MNTTHSPHSCQLSTRRQHSNPQWLQHLVAGLLLSLCLLLAIPSAEAATSSRILLLGSNDSAIYQRVVAGLQQQLPARDWQLDVHWLDQQPAQLDLQSYDLLITIGTAAAQWSATQQSRTPVLHTLITRQAVEALAIPQAQQLSASHSAIYLEQPYQRQLRFLQLLRPEAKRVGTLLGPHSKHLLPRLQQLSSGYGLQLNAAILAPEDNPVQRLQPVVANSEVFLAVPDQAVFNRNTAKWILMMSYRYRTPLIAYSRRYVEAGALAAIYSSPQSIARDTAGWLQQWQAQPAAELPAPRYPHTYEIDINPATARSLGITLPDISTLKRELEP